MILLNLKQEYLQLIVFFVLSFILSVFLLLLSYSLSKKQKSDIEKLSAYECGFDPFGEGVVKAPVRYSLFFLVAPWGQRPVVWVTWIVFNGCLLYGSWFLVREIYRFSIIVLRYKITGKLPLSPEQVDRMDNLEAAYYLQLSLVTYWLYYIRAYDYFWQMLIFSLLAAALFGIITYLFSAIENVEKKQEKKNAQRGIDWRANSKLHYDAIRKRNELLDKKKRKKKE